MPDVPAAVCKCGFASLEAKRVGATRREHSGGAGPLLFDGGARARGEEENRGVLI